MKVLILSDANSIHTKRWVKSLSEKGIEIVLYSITLPSDDFYEKNGIRTHVYHLFDYKKKGGLAAGLKRNLRHFQAAADLKRVLKLEKPDILHAHYATSYGLVAALSGFHPFIISVWGADVYDFPNQSRLKKESFRFILRKADQVLSTSDVMAKEISRYTDKKIVTTPFGVDIHAFRPLKAAEPDEAFRIGTVKTLSSKYGIDYLIRAFEEFIENHRNEKVLLEIAGNGPDREKLEQLAADLDISSRVVFRGYVDHDLLPEIFNRFDISVFLSVLDSESFGVAAVEAMACGTAVIVSDVDGFTEVVEDQVSGIIVPRKDIHAAAVAMEHLYQNEKERRCLASEARKRVEKLYDWDKNVQKMISVYHDCV